VDRVAIEELLALRTKRGEAPIELSASAFMYERHGFGTPDDTLAILAQRPEVAGVVGHEVPHGSVESILASRLGMPIVDTAPGDPGSGVIGDPWVFRCDRYGHDGQAAVLDALLADFDRPRLAVVRTPGAETARRLDFWVGRAAKRGARIVVDVNWDPAVDDPGVVVTKLRRARVQAVLTWSDAHASAVLLGGMRQAGLRAALVGGPAIVNEEFARSAPPDAGTVLAVAPCLHVESVDGPAPESLHDRSREAAAHLLAAVENAGRDREAVRGRLLRVRSQAVARLTNGAWATSPYGQERPSRGVPFDRAPSGPSPDGHAFVARTR
jgi:ABC-type branched-subunit amino acid transport system substrate-binding protein